MLFIFDVDGTLIDSFLEQRTCTNCDGRGKVRTVVKKAYVDDDCVPCRGTGTKLSHKERSYDEVIWLPGRRSRLQAIANEGHHVALATNQTGVSYGYQTREQVDRKLDRVRHESGLLFFPAFVVYDAADIERRKPAPGMLVDAMRHWGYKPWETIFVGDMDVDQQAARNAKVAFSWAVDFFS